MNLDLSDDRYLGDPRFYTKEILKAPPLDPLYLQIYEEKFHVTVDRPREFEGFLKSSELLDFLAEFDFNLFCERKLDHIVKPFHVEWANKLEENKRIIILAPRDHGKSQFLRDYVLWCAYYKKRVNILIISETLSQAKNLLSGEDSIKEQILQNPDLYHLYPGTSSGKWSETLLHLSNGVRIEIAGYGQRLRGRHPDLLLLDDVLSDQNSGTPEMRKKVFHEYTHTVYPTAKKYTKIFVVGTAHHPEDLLFTLGDTGQYDFTKYQAVDEVTKETLWPERHSYESLQEIRKAHGELAYQREYQNNPMADSLMFFPPELLDNCKDFDISYQTYYSGNDLVHWGGDLSPPGGAKSGKGDWTVFSAFRLDTKENLVMLNYERFRDTPSSMELFFEKQLDCIRTMTHRFKVDHGFLEEVGFQAIYTKEFIRKTSRLPIVGFTVTAMGKRSVTAGVPYIRGLMEKRKIRFPYATKADQEKTDIFLKDFAGVMLLDNGKIGNTSYHDDCMTSTWMAVESSKTIQKPMFTMKSPLKKDAASKPRFRGVRTRFRGLNQRKKK